MQKGNKREHDKGYYSYKEIAQILGVSIDNVRRIEKQALYKIKSFDNRHKLSAIVETINEINAQADI